jgi:Fe-S cluster assembly protein SufB
MSISEIPLPAPKDAGETALDRQQAVADDLKDYKFGWSDSDEGYSFTSGRGLTKETVAAISDRKNEPTWMLDLRLRAFEAYERRPMPNWGSDLSGIHFDDIYYYVEASEGQVNSWEDLPPEIMETYEKLGIPEAERKRLVAGVAAQYESTVLYHKVREDLEEQGVIFKDTDTALVEDEELMRKYFATIIPPNDNKFAALNTAVWSGGSFIYVPEGVKIDVPLQAYFRINKENMGQFERTLIIAAPGSYVHYVEGCTAPTYSSDSLHSAVVEILVQEGARVRYTTIQNWSTNVYNLVTKRAIAEKNATMEWIDGNIGSKVTMKYPAVWLTGEGAKGEVLSVAYAHDGQHQDAGAKMVHVAPNTTSNILSKSISKGTGRTSYRGLVKVEEGATGVRSSVKCDALMLDDSSRSDTYPYMEIEQDDATIEHEATVSKLSEDQMFYLQARGIAEDDATAMIVRGFIEPIVRELPMEYAVELNRLMEIEMEGAIG